MNIIQVSSEPFALSCRPTQDDRNVNGKVHGGVIFYLCDDAVGRYVTAQGKVGAAADGSIHFYRPANIGETITATLSERKVGRRLGVYLVEARNEEGKLLADALFTIAFSE